MISEKKPLMKLNTRKRKKQGGRRAAPQNGNNKN